jgi:hypothetical protein
VSRPVDKILDADHQVRINVQDDHGYVSSL